MFTIDPEEGLSSFTGRVLDTAAATVPELAGPAYIIGMELPHMRGVHIPGLDQIFRPEIEAAGKWQGPGPAAAVDQAQIYQRMFAAARAAGLDEQRSDLEARRQIAACIIHELGHAIDKGDDGEQGILSHGPEIARNAFDNFLHDEPLPEPFTVAAPIVPWKGHDLRFIRCCAILHSRVVPDLPLRLPDIIETSLYGLSPARTYARAMQFDGDFDFDDRTPIREILDLSPGDILKAKWRQDVLRWFQRSPMGDKETEAAEQALALCNGRRAKAEAVPVAAASDDYLPQPFEHFYELRPTPEDWLHDSFQSETVADGIRRMVAKLRTGEGDEEPAAYYFDCNRFSLPDATGWMEAHGIRYAHCVPAKNATYPQLTA